MAHALACFFEKTKASSNMHVLFVSGHPPSSKTDSNYILCHFANCALCLLVVCIGGMVWLVFEGSILYIIMFVFIQNFFDLFLLILFRNGKREPGNKSSKHAINYLNHSPFIPITYRLVIYTICILP